MANPRMRRIRGARARLSCLAASARALAAASIAQPVALLAALLAAQLAHAAPGEELYRYTDGAGRTVYTNVDEQVPLEQRASGRLDLSNVSLNSELARELDDRFEREHEALIQTPYCAKARQAAQPGVVRHMWDEYGPLLACGGLLLLLALYTPRALKRYGAPVWAKILTFAIPTVAVVGVIGFSATKAQHKVSALRARAAPCEKQTFALLSEQQNPLLAHQELIDRLRREIDQATGR